jgi:precorrin-3B synthase
MPTGDGLLARLLPTGLVRLDAMAGFCAAARRHGNGIIEVTARGSLQVRGLTPVSAPLFAADVAELGIAAQESVPVIAGFDDGAADLLTQQLRRAIAAARLALSPKVSVVVDGDGSLHLDGLSADVRLRAEAHARAQSRRLHLGIGVPQGATSWLGKVAPEGAVRAVIGILSIIAAHGPAARAADVLHREGVQAFQDAAGIAPAPAPPPRVPADMIGLHAMRDGLLALGVGLVFGHTHSDALAELVGVAVCRGVRAVRPMPDRAMLLTGVSALNAGDLIVTAERLGFVVQADDPRRRIAACPGAPACASGLIPARMLASMLAPVIAPLLPPERNGVLVHIAGCPKGCAHPGPAALTLVGTAQGCGVIHNGSAREMPPGYVDAARFSDHLAHLVATSTKAAHG